MTAQVPLDPALQSALDLTGTFAFAVSGALLAVRKRFDLVGLIILAAITAVGGGVIRDLLLGRTPPLAFRTPTYLAVALAAAAVTFVAAPQLERLKPAVLLFDAAGLALFVIAGTAAALAHHLGPLPAIGVGITTGIGGGILRDLVAGDVPVVVREDSELYAVPACLGCVIVVAAAYTHRYGTGAAAAAVLAVFGLRTLAVWRHWRAPRPRALWPRRGG